MSDFSIELSIIKDGYKIVAGIDEAGRGPLAGPVVAAAVILPIDADLFAEVDDSKVLSEKKRDRLYDVIVDNAVAYAICAIDNITIDDVNILNATMLAMENSVKQLGITPDFLLIDGNRYNDTEIPYRTVIKGDSISKSIGAASILAKVKRDRWMCEVAHNEFPEYNFAKHKGYATKEHIQLIQKYGTCKYHRRSFLRNILQDTTNQLFI
ncbi:MAG: ribonuclease HII [Ignavibacteria bacterium]|jgi:ribonuclease HII|nr:ribonuclease HII [Ignavibacteria bacterium]